MALEIAYPDSGKYRSATVLPPAYGLSAISGTLPPAYGLNETTFDFGFPSALDSRITFTASTTRNRFNSSGTLTSTAIDVARANANQDYNPSTLAGRGFLIEAGATNLLLRSQEFDNASWGKVDIVVTANDSVAPDGTTTADLLTEGSAGTSSCNQSVTIVAASTLTQTFFVKRSGATPVQWVKTVVESAGGLTRAWFDIQNGVVGTLGPSAGTHTVIGRTITSLPNSWYRVSLTVTIATDTSASVILVSAAADNDNARLNNSTYLLWGAQYEVGAFATSYIATTTAAVARGADNATITNLASIGFSQTQGFVYAEFMREGMGSAEFPSVLAFSDGTNNNRISLFVNDFGADLVTLNVASGGVTQANITAGSAVTANTLVKVAASWSANSFRLAVNGSAGTEDTSGTVPTVSQLLLGKAADGGNYLNGRLPILEYGPQLLTSEQLASMTA